MTRPTRKPHRAPSGLVDGVRGRLWDQEADGTAVGPEQLIKAHLVRRIVVLEAAGRLSEVGDELDRAIQLALAEGPRGVTCDLSGVLEDPAKRAVEALATAGRHVRDWPGIPVAVACADPRVRALLSAHPLGGHLIVTASMLSALSAVLATPAPAVEWLRLAPHPTAARASRDFVSRTLMGWGLRRVIPSASLVVSELVTNSTMYAGTDIQMSVVWNMGALRLTVRDNSPNLPHQRHGAVELHGRGLTIVAGLTRAFGVLPTADGGKVVWAVLDAPAPDPSARPSQSDPATKESPMFTGPASLPRLAKRAFPPAPLGDPQAPARHGAATPSALATKQRPPRQLTLARGVRPRHAHPHPYNDPSNYLG